MTAPSARPWSRPSSAVVARGVLRLAAWLYTGLVLYGSLLPFDFYARPLREVTRAFAQGGLFGPSRTDWATNVAVFVPMALLWMGASSDRKGWSAACWRALLVMGGCVALSAAIEFLQLWLPSRTSSLGDLAANAVGGMLGILFWLFVGSWIRQTMRDLIEHHIGEARRSPPRPAILMVMVSSYGVMLIALAGWFTRRTLGWTDALVRLSSLHLLPLYYHQQASILVSVPSAIVVACAYLPVGVLRWVVAAGGRPFRIMADACEAALWGGGIAAFFEVSKLLLDGKRADTGNILIAMLAAPIGYLLAPGLLRRFGGMIWR